MLKFNFVGIDFVRAFVDGQLQVKFFLTDQDETINVRHIKIITTDPYFDLIHYPSEFEDHVSLNTNWFVEFHLNSDYGYAHKLGYKGGIHLRVLDMSNNELIFDNVVWLFKKYLPIRQNSSEIAHDVPRVFAIGDSHVWHNYGGRNFTTANGYPIIKYSVPSLTMHTFVSGNYKDFIGFLPIEPQDYLMFNFGDCDLRNTFMKHAMKYGKDVKQVIYETCQKYFMVIKEIASFFPECKIFLTTPNFIVSEQLAPDVSHFVPICGTQDERKMMYDFFVTLIKTQPFFRVLDCPTIYRDHNGFISTEYLEPKDIHVSDFQYFVKELDEFISNYENS
jgi:hypothetical protein